MGRSKKENSTEEEPEVTCKLFGQYEGDDDSCKICGVAARCEAKTKELETALDDQNAGSDDTDGTEDAGNTQGEAPPDSGGKEVTDPPETDDSKGGDDKEPELPEDPEQTRAPETEDPPAEITAKNRPASSDLKTLRLGEVELQVSMDDVRVVRRLIDLITLLCVLLSRGLDPDND